ncbi:YkvA family protein [Chitinophaga vietnamensis]|uniref:YkvA family protein n=1 Tax=Chitinophaga vietnamensis TaxID=2593957 RepID=UPI00117743BA|nr:YkvA family protein [Chitinophaga vietnamensis]
MAGLISILKQKVKLLKQECHALYLAYRHPDTPWYAKVLIAFTLAYLLSPVDLIPDFIPILGYLDDLLIVPLLITLSVRLIPMPVMEQCRKQAGENPVTLKKSWQGAVVIIMIWLVLLVVLIKWVVYRV